MLVLSIILILILLRYMCGQSAFKFHARQQNPAPALVARQTDIGTQAHDGPFIAAARMWFAQFNPILQLDRGESGFWHTIILQSLTTILL